MSSWPILSLVTFLPLAGVAFILFIRGEPDLDLPPLGHKSSSEASRA